MEARGYKIRDQSAIHFITFAVVGWVDVFTRKPYRDIVLDSVRYCQDGKGLLLHAWCIMSNHWHLVLRPKTDRAISELMCWVGVTHVRRYHSHHQTVGGTFGAR